MFEGGYSKLSVLCWRTQSCADGRLRGSDLGLGFVRTYSILVDGDDVGSCSDCKIHGLELEDETLDARVFPLSQWPT